MPIQHSAAVLRSETSPGALTAVAAVALAEAIRQKLDIPSDSAALLWAALRRNPDAEWARSATEAIGEVADAPAISLVLRALLDRDTGVALANRAIEVLSGPAAAPHVSDRNLGEIADRARGRLVFTTATMILSVCEHRRVPQETVKKIAETWSRRSDTESRQSALDLTQHVPREVAQQLVEGALSDGSLAIRATAVTKIAELYGREHGLAIVARALRTETDARMIAYLLNAWGGLLTNAPARASEERTN